MKGAGGGPKPSPAPLDFAAKALEFNGEKEALKRFYGVGRTKVNRWLAEIGDAGTEKVYTLADLPTGRPAEMLEERDLDPEVWQVRGLRVNEWEMAGELQRQTRLDIVPRPETLRAARPDGWKRPKIKQMAPGASEMIAVCGDQHAPEHDRAFHAKFLSWLRRNLPSQIIILGDLLENADVSRWADRKGQATVKESIDAAYLMLRDYIEAAPDAEIVWIAGNHDHRIEIHAEGSAPKLSDIARAGESDPILSVPYLMRLDELGIEYIADYPLGKKIIAPNLAVIHGSTVKKGAGATALANLEKRGYSVISGHTHRAGIVFKTVLDIDDSPSTLIAAETGTMKEIKPEVFDVAPDHQNAFMTVTVWKDGQFHIEPAIYSGGNLRWRNQRF